jgi:hypothetical protein
MSNNYVPEWRTVAPYVKPDIGTTWKTNLVVTHANEPSRVVTHVDQWHVYYTWQDDPSYLEHKASRYYWTRYMTQVPTEV